MPVLALAALLNGLMNMPYQLQLAYGWTRLMLQSSVVALVILVPAILILVPRYGAISAAWSGVVLNGGYLIFNVFFMHRRILPREHFGWLINDVLSPLAAATLVACAWRVLVPSVLGRVAEIVILAIGYGLCTLGAILAAPIVRCDVIRNVSSGWRALRASG